MTTLRSIACGVTAFVSLALARESSAQTAVALTGANTLYTFNLSTPQTGSNSPAISGLNPGESIVGMDYRPINRLLVAVTSASRLVALNPTSGVATPLATLSVPLAGSNFGVDFNPVPDRLRVVSDAGQNLRINVDTGAVIVDGPLAFAASDTNAGNAPQIVGAGYTNSVAGRTAVSTTLFDLDFSRDVLVRQDPPNNGTLVTIGALGVDFGAGASLDIYSPSMAYATNTVGANTTLYRINLTTGAATAAGEFPAGAAIRGLAIALKEPAVGLSNASARGLVGPGDGALISGFVVSGDAPVTVLINSRGPSLTQFGLSNAQMDTRIALYRGNSLLEENDNWQTHPRSAEITASGFAPGDARESSILVTLAPGAYTVVMGSMTTATAVAILEVYELP